MAITRVGRSAGRRAAGLAAALTLAAGAAAGAERLTPPLVFTGEVGDGLWAYGQFDSGLLVHDDGQSTEAYFVNNENSSPRAGLWYRTRAADDFVFSANFEYQWTPVGSGRVNRLDSDWDWSSHKLRKLEAIFEIDWIGRIWVGQGSSATDGIAESDLSGTSLIAYSLVSDTAGGQLFALAGGGLSGVSIGSAFKNYDGGRYVRLRYDTPDVSGFRLGASTGVDVVGDKSDVEWDVGLTYAGGVEGWKLKAALGYYRPEGERNRISGSASGLHEASGLSLTFAAGTEERSVGDDPMFLYAKLGWQADLISAGRTFFGLDGYWGDAVKTDGSESLSVGLSAVQAVPAWQTDFYAVVRWHSYDDDAARYDDGVAVMTGLRFAF